MSRKYRFGNSEALIVNDISVKKNIIDFIFNSINLNNYRYHVLKNVQKLEYLKNNEHYVSPNFYGYNYLLVFKNIGSTKYCVAINRKTLSYHKDKINYDKVSMIKIIMNVSNEIFKGSIFETKLIKDKKENYSLIINDCYYLMGDKKTNMEMKQKIGYIDTIINTHFKISNNMCDNFNVMTNKLFDYRDLPKIVKEIIPTCKYSIQGLVFYPKLSGITTIYSDKKQQKVDIKSSNTENIKSSSYDFIFNITDFLKSRTYSYEETGKCKDMILKRTNIRDVYSVFEEIGSERIGIAMIPNLRISQMCNEKITNYARFKCRFNKKFDKWVPINFIESIVV